MVQHLLFQISNSLLQESSVNGNPDTRGKSFPSPSLSDMNGCGLQCRFLCPI